MPTVVGHIEIIHRYPVKSMQGEQIGQSYVDERGLLGDRSLALQEVETGHIVSAKHPRKWPTVLTIGARYAAPLQQGQPLPDVSVELPDGTQLTGHGRHIDEQISAQLGRSVRLLRTAPTNPTREANRADVDELTSNEQIREEPLAEASPTGTFFDHAPIHIVTTSSLERLAELDPDTNFDYRRFRPNVVIRPVAGMEGFVEMDWLGMRLQLGDSVDVDIIDPSPRCVITTQQQEDLPRDLNVLRTVAKHTEAISINFAKGTTLKGVLGVYGAVIQNGTIQVGDLVSLVD